VIIGDVIDRDDALAHDDHALDHPIERTAREHLFSALRPHARSAYRRRDFALLFLGALDLPDLPLGQIFNAVGADAELYDVEGHGSIRQLVVHLRANLLR
jgi:hypothetical protein